MASALSALVESGKLREDTKLVDFEKIAEFGAYNVNGEFVNQYIQMKFLIRCICVN